MVAFDPEPVKSALVKLFHEADRGAQARLAVALNVTAATVHKYAKGQVCPEPEKWPAIEEFFGMDPGELGVIASLREDRPLRFSYADADLMFDRMNALDQRLSRLETIIEPFLAGAERPAPNER